MMMVSYKILLHSRPYSNAIAIEEFHNILINAVQIGQNSMRNMKLSQADKK